MSASSPLPRTLVGRMASFLLIAGAVMAFLAEVVVGQFHERTLIIWSISFVVGLGLWLLPWAKLGPAGTIGLFVLSIWALILGEATGPRSIDSEFVPVFVMTLFAWNGLAHPRWMSLKLLPVVSLAYAIPLLLHQREVTDLFGVVFTLPFSVFLGETIAWITDRLTTAENEALLVRQKQDFLTAAQHELRTPLTTVGGYASTLKARGDSLSAEQRSEFIEGILKGTHRMQNLLRRIDDLKNLEQGKPLDLSEMGLLAAHYGDADMDLDDPLRGGSSPIDDE